MIIITKIAEKFIGRCNYGEQPPLKSAGFRWSPADKYWWTNRAEIAAKLREQCDTDATAALDALLADRDTAIVASRAASADITVPAPTGLAYLPYQRAGIAYTMARQNTLIGDEMGLGKTIQAIGAWNADPTCKSALIVCPASLRINWSREWQKWDTRGASVGIANGAALPTTDVVVINYDVLKKHRAALRARTWDLLIVDECHYVKNPKAQRTVELLGKLAKEADKIVAPIAARRRIFLTGTPIVNRPIELWPLLRAMDPADLGKSWRGYAVRYCGGQQTRYGWDVSGATNLDELQLRLREKLMVRRVKADVLTELPPKRRQVIALPADGCADVIAAETSAVAQCEARTATLRAAVELAKCGDIDVYQSAVAALRAASQAAFTEISKLRHATALAKLPMVMIHLRDQLDAGNKVVVFAHHHDVVAAIAAEFGAAAVTLTGETAMAERQAAVDRFQADPTCTLFIGSIHAAGVGITLTAAAHVIFAELDWVPGNMSQAEDRCHRIGQSGSVLVQHLVLDGSIDATMAQTITAKQDIIDRALDDPASTDIAQIPVSVSVCATDTMSRKIIDLAAPTITADQITAVHTAIKLLAGMCDGARKLDDAGFSKIDVAIGHSLAVRGQLTAKQAVLGRVIARKYQRQFPAELLAAMTNGGSDDE